MRETAQERHWKSRRRLSVSLSSIVIIFLLLLVDNAAVTIQQRQNKEEPEEEVIDLDHENKVDITKGLTDVETLQKIMREERNEETADSHHRDALEDGIFDPLAADPSCHNLEEGGTDQECWKPPDSTVEETIVIDASCAYGGDDPSSVAEEQCTSTQEQTVDKHWGSDPHILEMREQLRKAGFGMNSQLHQEDDRGNTKARRPPIFLMPGLASTRLVAWRFKKCAHHPLLSDIKVQDYVWLNINLVLQMATVSIDCFKECISLGMYQADTDDWENGCKLRPDEGLDAISSLAPGSIGSNLLVGGTNTVYAWLVQWLADNLGYDVGNIIGLPYDWRLSPDRMEERDGFFTLTRRRIEAAVKSNGAPGIMVAHSMGNTVFRYFLTWLRQEMRQEAYQKFVKSAQNRARRGTLHPNTGESFLHGWVSGAFPGLDDWWNGNMGKGQDGTEPDGDVNNKQTQLWELAQMEGDVNYIDWLENHIWTYVGLSAPLLGAINPLRAVLSGENMGLPIPDEMARVMELTFGSTHTVNPISSKMAFCDQWDTENWGEEPSDADPKPRRDLFCLDDLMNEIDEYSSPGNDPWQSFPVLKSLLKDRVDWDTSHPMISVIRESCKPQEKSPCGGSTATTNLGPRDVQTGDLFTIFNRIWNETEKPMLVKREQLSKSWWETSVPNILNQTWDRPHIKHVIMAYGVDVPTEAGYIYRKREESDKEQRVDEYDGIPSLEKVIWEEPGGKRTVESHEAVRGKSITESIIPKKKPKREVISTEGRLKHSGDGTIPYLSLAWSFTWLLHGIRAKRFSEGEEPGTNALDYIQVSHRPQGAMEWVQGPPSKVTISDDRKKKEDGDTGTTHPHGTKYKPEMVRFHNEGRSRKTGMEYSTTVVEAIGVEHKETTRNYDILAAVFTDVLEHMHADLGLEQDT